MLDLKTSNPITRRYITLWHGLLEDYMSNLEQYYQGAYICTCDRIVPLKRYLRHGTECQCELIDKQ